MKKLIIKVFFTGIWLMIYLISLAQNYELLWSDEFNYSGLPDPDKWTFVTGAGDNIAGNNELEYYTNRLENAEVRDSILVITARRESYGGRNYTSARINTYNKHYWKYGKFEARIKLPYGQGIWPAFWMLGKNSNSIGWPRCGEIDILEMVGGDDRENTVMGGVFWDHGGILARYVNSITLPSGIFADDFHIFSIEWNAERILWRMDETQYSVFDITGAKLSEFHQEFYIILNLAVGGTLPGSPDSTTIFPQELQVDYVRVYFDSDTVPNELENSEYERQLQLFPNPADNEIMIDADEKYKSYCIIDFTGKVLYYKLLKDNRIDISNLRSGIYLLRLENHRGDIIYRKIIKQ
jgi:beta-glucanase (GH16 family)